MTRLQRLVTELRRRRIFRAAGIYIVNDVGIGTASPDGRLHLYNTNYTRQYIEAEHDSGYRPQLDRPALRLSISSSLSLCYGYLSGGKTANH